MINLYSGVIYTIPIPKGDDFATLRAAVDDAIKAMKADGTLSQLSIKYFGIDVSK